MAGALIVGDVPSYEQSLFKDFVVEINRKDSDEKILNILKYWLLHNKERKARARLGQEIILFKLQRTWASWVEAAIGGTL